MNSSILSVEDIINFEDEFPELESPKGRGGQATFVAIDQVSDRSTSGEYWLAKYTQDALHKEGTEAVFRLYDLDVLLVPTEPNAARLGAVGRLPVGTVPLGYDEIGLPFGMAFVGKRYDEGSVLRAMSAFEANFPARHPPSLLN